MAGGAPSPAAARPEVSAAAADSAARAVRVSAVADRTEAGYRAANAWPVALEAGPGPAADVVLRVGGI